MSLQDEKTIDAPISGLRPITRFITTHREDGKAIIHPTPTAGWRGVRNNDASFNLLYTTSEFPAQMNNDADLTKHEEVARAGTGLVNKGGSVCRIVDFTPSGDPFMHRTRSLDYGVVLEGEMEMILDSGETVLMNRGDVAVQRGTMHAWRNPSSSEWARMLFVLLDSHPLEIGGERLGENLGESSHNLSESDREFLKSNNHDEHYELQLQA